MVSDDDDDDDIWTSVARDNEFWTNTNIIRSLKIYIANSSKFCHYSTAYFLSSSVSISVSVCPKF